MTTNQFQERVKLMGGDDREAELISAKVYPEWMSYPATKLTFTQKCALRTLLFDQREEDQINARIDNDHINRTHAAGFVVRGVCFTERI